jgi:Domain of unknown function (DUF4164)
MPSATEEAVRRLEAALRGLESAVAHRLTMAAGAESLAEEVRALASDRARLAENLDQSIARGAKLETINRDVAQRLEKAIETIQVVLQTDERNA